MKSILTSLLTVTFFFMPISGVAQSGGYPPLSPSWVFSHWVWEDNENTQAAVLQLVRGYEKHGIPVGVVIIDSPWSTEYNNFTFHPKSYPDPKKLITQLHDQDIKVLLWMTSILNKKTFPGEFEPRTSHIFRAAKRKKYLAHNGALSKWWKGSGAFIDYENPQALAWWHSQMDKAMDMGIDGWKVDVVDAYFPKRKKKQTEAMSRTEFRKRYYSDMYDYSVSRNPNSAVLVRSVDRSLGTSSEHFSPISKSNVTWVGDQRHTWKGLMLALRNVLSAAREGYAVVGSDIGGYDGPAPITKELLVRWAQFGALCPLMENGGEGTHTPWSFDQETVSIYRFFTKLHVQLEPYWFSLMTLAHRGGMPILRPLPKSLLYTIGDYLLVSPIVSPDHLAEFTFPDGEWLDYWNPEHEYRGGDLYRTRVPLHQYPLFVRKGALIPMSILDDETGHSVTSAHPDPLIDVYPGQETEFVIASESGTSVRIHLSTGESQFEISSESPHRAATLRVWLRGSPSKVMVDGKDYRRAENPEILNTPDAANFFYHEASKRLYLKFWPNQGRVRVES